MSQPSPPLEIDCQTVSANLRMQQDFVLLDCREPDEYTLVHIPGALLVPMSQITSRLSELEKYRQCEIAVHCHHGGRSLKVALWLREQGFAQAQSMAGGIDAWALEIDRTLARY